MKIRKMMVSQPMHGKTEDEIKATRDTAMEFAKVNNLEFVNTLFTDEWYSEKAMEERGVRNRPMMFIAKSIENMSLCDIAYFAMGWEDTRGCKIEHEVAKAYGMGIVYE